MKNNKMSHSVVEIELKGGKKKYKGKKHRKSEEKEGEMSYTKNGRTYYKSYNEAVRVARKWDRIYYDAFEKAYYIVRPQKRGFWVW